MGPKLPTPITSNFLSLKYSITLDIVSSGVVVGILILSIIFPSSVPRPQINFVPPASTAAIIAIIPLPSFLNSI